MRQMCPTNVEFARLNRKYSTDEERKSAQRVQFREYLRRRASQIIAQIDRDTLTCQITIHGKRYEIEFYLTLAEGKLQLIGGPKMKRI